jgi:hypothetical protein
VAKRSVKRERLRAEQQTSNGPRPEPAAASVRPRRSFWLGALLAAAILVPAAIVAVVVASGSDEDPRAGQEAAFDEEVEGEAARLRRQTQVRDREQVEELTGRMRQMVDDLQPVLSGLARTFPPGRDNRTGRLASAADVERWRAPLREADRYFENPPSGETGTNVARGGFSASIDALVGAVDTYALALRAAGERPPLLERARDQRNLAIRSWSVAATQLDAINIATGFGHQHVYLGASEQVGGFGADPAPEGSGAEDGG